jgi:hypothetical protein
VRHSSFTAVYDACVLYPAPLRDLSMTNILDGDSACGGQVS